MYRLAFFAAIVLTCISCGQRNKRLEDDSQNNQNDSIGYFVQALQFIRQVRLADLANTQFILEDATDGVSEKCLKEALSDISSLSRQEGLWINRQANHPYIHRWTNQLFPKIKIVNSDTIRKIFENKSQGWEYFYQHVGHRADYFSAPVFFNNYTSCLFYSGYSCGFLCAYGSLILYKKEGNHWTEVKSYCTWIS
jgi:hypothetical protein